jgi:hypothetical protein
MLAGGGLALPKGAASSAPTTRTLILGDIVRAFKSQSAIQVNRLLGRRKPLGQRNDYEHIIRAGEDLDEIHPYVFENSQHWSLDRENGEWRAAKVE